MGAVGGIFVTCVVFMLMWAVMGCAPAQSPTNSVQIPNLSEVSPNVWRSGQPTTAEQWVYIRDVLGVRTVVKLNFEAEGSDQGARDAGLNVEYLPIQPEGDRDIWDEIEGTFVKPDPSSVGQAVGALATARPGAGVLVHCTHGQDRTGLVVAIYRHLYEGWSKDAAFDEAESRGFHIVLTGLTTFWIKNVE